MKKAIFFVSIMICVFTLGSMAQGSKQVYFNLTLGTKIYKGYIYGTAGIWKLNYDKENPFEITDERGIVHQIFVDKIDTIEISLPKKAGAKPQIMVLSQGNEIDGEFQGASIYFVTEVEKLDLLQIKKGKVLLTKAR